VASGTSKETEIKLTNVARASLEELREDYRDFLRLGGFEEWDKNHPYAKRLSVLARTPGAHYETFRKAVEHADPAIAANAILGLIKITTYLLDQQLRQLEKAFVKEGGLRERMTRARLNERAGQAVTRPRGSFRNQDYRIQALSRMKDSEVPVERSQSPKICFFPASLQRVQHYM
jgi:four helix bundle suffix protein